MITRPARVLVITALVFILSLPSHSSLTAPNKTFTVNSLADSVDVNPGDEKCEDADGNCTLRAAVMEANAFVGKDTIKLPEGTIHLKLTGSNEDMAETGDLDITDKLIVEGSGYATTIIDAFIQKDRVFDILKGTHVEIKDVTVRNGTSYDPGGGIKNEGNLKITGSKIEDNYAGNPGGGIANISGEISVMSSIIRKNFTAGGGGGIANFKGVAYVSNTTISENSTDPYTGGGGISNAEGILYMNNSTVSGNKGSSGGGLILGDSNTYITNSTISGNRACYSGGGFYSSSGKLELFNATVIHNRANMKISDESCYIEGANEADEGGGIKRSAGEVNLHNTIIAENNVMISSFFFTTDDCKGTLGSLHYSLLGSSDGCTFTNQNSIIDQDPKIDNLVDNGGPTQTHALQEGSPAVDAADPKGCKDQDGVLLSTDQRGYVRPFDGDENGTERCDMGAYEAVKDSEFVYLPLSKK